MAKEGRKGRVIGDGDYLDDDGLFVPHSSDSVENREGMAEQVWCDSVCSQCYPLFHLDITENYWCIVKSSQSCIYLHSKIGRLTAGWPRLLGIFQSQRTPSREPGNKPP